MTRLVLILALALAFSPGCVPPRPIVVGEIPTLSPDEGILVLDVESDVPIERLALNGVPAVEHLEAGHQLALLVVEAGSYRWTAIQIPGASGSARFRIRREDEWTFHVEAGRINYPGTILVSHRSGLGSIQLYAGNLNRSAMTWVELKRRFPQLVERYVVIYSGPAKDGFLAQLATLQASKRAAAAREGPE